MCIRDSAAPSWRSSTAAPLTVAATGAGSTVNLIVAPLTGRSSSSAGCARCASRQPSASAAGDQPGREPRRELQSVGVDRLQRAVWTGPDGGRSGERGPPEVGAEGQDARGGGAGGEKFATSDRGHGSETAGSDGSGRCQNVNMAVRSPPGSNIRHRATLRFTRGPAARDRSGQRRVAGVRGAGRGASAARRTVW